MAIAGMPLWAVLLVIGSLLGPVYLVLPDDGRDLAYLIVAWAAPLLMAMAIAHYRPGHHVWTLVALGVALMAAGELAWLADAAGLSGGSVADPLYLLGYVPLCAAMAGAARRQGAGLGPAIDAAIVSVAAASVMWLLAIGPALAAGSESFATVAVAVAYPVADVVVLGLLLRILLDRPRATRAMVLFAIGVSTFLMADLAYSVLVVEDRYASVSWTSADGVRAVGAAACHPLRPRARQGPRRLQLSNVGWWSSRPRPPAF